MFSIASTNEAKLGVDYPQFEAASKFISRVYNNTWFSVEYSPHVNRTLRGSLAGMPLADLMCVVAKRQCGEE